MSRGKKAAINTTMALVEEVVAVICGFILPRLVLNEFGSQYNGLISSITQFLSCAVLLRSGIGGATRAALYKPLATNDKTARDSIIKATDIYMKKIGLILAGLILAFAALYPFIVGDEFGWTFTFLLFIIIGASTFAESFFGITYLTLLQADQRLWISTLLKTICYILNTVISVVLIRSGCIIHVVKMGSALIYVLYPIAMSVYVKKHYQIDKHAKPDNQAIAQRWDAFWQQVAVFAINNTGTMVLTFFATLAEVSVYSVYMLIVNGLRRAVFTLTNGLEAPLGNMVAKGESNNLRINLQILELLIQGFCTVVYATAALLILQFVGIYTSGISDVNYIRPGFAYVLLLSQFFYGAKIPYQSLSQAAGHYKETRNGALVETFLNISVSSVLVMKHGLIGVAIGNLIATVFRTVQYSIHVCKHIVQRKQIYSLLHVFVSITEAMAIFLIVNSLHLLIPTTYGEWFINAVIIGCISVAIVFLGSVLFYRKDFILCVTKIKRILRK